MAQTPAFRQEKASASNTPSYSIPKRRESRSLRRKATAHRRRTDQPQAARNRRISGKRSGRIRTARLPGNLPVREKNVIPGEVLDDPESWHCIGEDVTDELELQPGYFYINRTVYKEIRQPGRARAAAADRARRPAHCRERLPGTEPPGRNHRRPFLIPSALLPPAAVIPAALRDRPARQHHGRRSPPDRRPMRDRRRADG